MDGSYGNVFPTSQAISPSIPAPSSNDQYKVNVNRQKTRKWANFKPQNYDGDDWGADYDEPAYEPEPPPPPKPMGPRSPAAHSPVARQFQPAGSPPLRAQTQQQPALPSMRSGHPETFSGPPSNTGGPPRRATEPTGPQAQKTLGHVQRDVSPDSPKPWMEARSTSPQGAQSLASPNKPLPLIRPADVYRRMEEERERERLSLEAGSPGPDNAVGRSAVAPVSETRPQREAQVLSGGTAVVAAGANFTCPSGAPTTGRKSEDGFDGLLASYGTEEQQQVKPAEPQKSVQPVLHEELRRFSTSPRLPDVTRMSSFGEDLFSSTFFPASGLRSPVSGSMQQPPAPRHSAPDSGESAAARPLGQSATTSTAQNVGSSRAPDADRDFAAPQPASTANTGANSVLSPPNEPGRDPPVGAPSHQEGSSAAQPGLDPSKPQPPAADAAQEPASCIENRPSATATMPPLPSGRVPGNPSTPGEVAASAPAGDSPDPAEQAEGAEGVPSQTAIEPQPEVASLDGAQFRQSEFEEARAARDADTTDAGSPSRSQPASPDALAPLRTISPALSTKLGMGSGQDAQGVQEPGPPPSPGTEVVELNSPIPASAATGPPEITPTAPLNPRRGTPEVSPGAERVLPPPPFEAGSNPPIKDSDMLSEEILKSLGPAQPVGDTAHAAEGSAAAHRVAADPTRESSYLGDVYGDYWTAAEDKAEPALSATGGTGEPEKAAEEPSPPTAEHPKDNPAVSATTFEPSTPSTPSSAAQVKAPELRSESAVGHDGSRRRFSWEAALESSAPVTVSLPPAQHLVEQKALGFGADNVAPSTAKPDPSEAEPSQPSVGSEGGKSAEDLRAESAPEVHTAAPLAPMPASDSRAGRASPASIIEDSQSGGKRLSHEEEKIVLQEKPNRVSPSPPPEKHLVFEGSQQSRQGELASTPPPRNIVGFRNIMEMPSSAERIKNYNEARWQFSTVDTGLDEWLKGMMSKHPEHANAVLSYSAVASLARQNSQGAVQTPQGGRVPTHLHMPNLQHGLSGLGHSGNQMGTKSKEFLMAAGKAGKGLLSKGRSKFRGTGDKVFSS